MDWLRYLITRYELSDVPQVQMMGFMQSLLAEEMLTSPMVNTTAISDARLAKRTLYELDRSNFTRETTIVPSMYGCGQCRNPGPHSQSLGSAMSGLNGAVYHR